MVEEKEIVAFLEKRGGEASINDIAEGLGIPKYGPNSAYAFLQSLKNKGIVERRGELWTLTEEARLKSVEKPQVVERTLAKPAEEAGISLQKPEQKTETVISGDVENLVRAMAQALADAMRSVKMPADEWELATRPMTTRIEKEGEEKLKGLVQRPDEAFEAKKPLIGFQTGTFLDQLFLTPDGKSLGGIPICGQLAIVGLPGAGKSILVEEIAVRVASSGRKVLYATSEDTWKSATPRFDLQSRLKQKADILGLDWNKIRENLFVLDTVAYPELRDWNTFAETYRYVAEKEKIELAIIDSVTVLESYRGALKYRVMELARYNQVHGITALFVNQRSAEVWDSYDMAGGIGLAHNLDGTIIVDYGRVYWYDQQVDLGAERGAFVRIARVLDCRMCNFERRRIKVDITHDGFLKPTEAIPKIEQTKT